MKTKALISFTVTAKLICAFVFAYADCWFSAAMAQLSFYLKEIYFERIKQTTRFQKRHFILYPFKYLSHIMGKCVCFEMSTNNFDNNNLYSRSIGI